MTVVAYDWTKYCINQVLMSLDLLYFSDKTLVIQYKWCHRLVLCKWVMYLYFYCKYSHRFVYNWFCIFLFIITLFVRLCEWVDILLTCGKQHLSVKLKVWTHKASLCCPLFIEVPMPSYAVMCMCVRSIDFTFFDWILVLFPLCSVFCFVILSY